MKKSVQRDVAETSLQVGDSAYGTAKDWFDRGYGYGFIAVPGAKDIFVSARAITNAPQLEPGDRVQFDVRMDSRGRLFAANVTVEYPVHQDALPFWPAGPVGRLGSPTVTR